MRDENDTPVGAFTPTQIPSNPNKPKRNRYTEIRASLDRRVMVKAEMNSSTQTAGEPSILDPVYGLRDDLAEHFKPTSGYERLLVGAAAQALQRYQDAQKLERRLFEKVDPLELLTNNPDTFKTITRHVADCERAWRKALEEIRRAIRQREPGRLAQRPPRFSAAACAVHRRAPEHSRAARAGPHPPRVNHTTPSALDSSRPLGRTFARSSAPETGSLTFCLENTPRTVTNPGASGLLRFGLFFPAPFYARVSGPPRRLATRLLFEN